MVHAADCLSVDNLRSLCIARRSREYACQQQRRRDAPRGVRRLWWIPGASSLGVVHSWNPREWLRGHLCPVWAAWRPPLRSGYTSALLGAGRL